MSILIITLYYCFVFVHIFRLDKSISQIIIGFREYHNKSVEQIEVLSQHRLTRWSLSVWCWDCWWWWWWWCQSPPPAHHALLLPSTPAVSLTFRWRELAARYYLENINEVTGLLPNTPPKRHTIWLFKLVGSKKPPPIMVSSLSHLKCHHILHIVEGDVY